MKLKQFFREHLVRFKEHQIFKKCSQKNYIYINNFISYCIYYLLFLFSVLKNNRIERIDNGAFNGSLIQM